MSPSPVKVICDDLERMNWESMSKNRHSHYYCYSTFLKYEDFALAYYTTLGKDVLTLKTDNNLIVNE
jgi:hypothetical protein